MDVTDKSTSLKRNNSISRRLSTIGGPSVGGKWTRLLFVVLILALGCLCGNFVYKLAFAEQKSKNVRSIRRSNIHEPPSSRHGSSIKKDMSIQFRDYLPRNIFITTGNWIRQRESIKLFLQTYPDAGSFHIYCFLIEDKYKPFFAPFKNMNLLNSHSSLNNYQNSTTNKTLSILNFDKWLLDNFHQDDYIIVRMDSEKESEVAKRLRKTGALDWIDKYYTSTKNKETLLSVQKVFEAMGTPPGLWTDDEFTYSDFEIINKNGKDPTGPTSVINSCGHYTEFMLILIVSHANPQALYALETLKSFSEPDFLKTAVFLSREFIIQHRQSVESLIHTVHVGLYLENKTYADSQHQYNRIRNDFVESWRIFRGFESNPINLNYIYGNNISENYMSKLCDERYVSVFTGAKNINEDIPKAVSGEIINPGNITREHGQILSLDLTEEKSEVLMVNILQNYLGQMVDIKSCV